MIPVPLYPDMPVATNVVGKVVFPKQYYKCPKCDHISPLRGGWANLSSMDREDILKEATKDGKVNFYDLCNTLEARLREKNT